MTDRTIEPADFSQWRQARQQALAAADGWPSVVDLIWLDPGVLTVGGAADCDLVLPAAPAQLGRLEVEARQAFWHPAGSPAVPLLNDADGEPTVIRHGRHSFCLIEREGRLALRLRDREAPARLAFRGVDCFAYDPAWRIDARWEGGRACFSRDGEDHCLSPQDPAATTLHFVFADAGSGKDSYGGGRFLYAAAPVAGRLVLDFNRAENPPCAFTAFATCPLPPAGNRLPFAVTAGERRYDAEAD